MLSTLQVRIVGVFSVWLQRLWIQFSSSSREMMIAHALFLAGVVVGAGVTQSAAAAAAASSAGAAIYAKLDTPTGSNNNKSTNIGINSTVGGDTSPVGVSSLRRNALSAASTPPATPLAVSDAGDHIPPTLATTAHGLLSSFNSSSNRSDKSLDFSDPKYIDVRTIVQRLQAKPLTGQVCAWAWDHASQLAQTKKAPPVSLLAALWPATESCVARCSLTAQDVVEIVDAWFMLLQRWPRHFVFAPQTLRLFSSITMPAAVKRMSDARIAQLARACCGIAQYRVDHSSMHLTLSTRDTSLSARDLMQPIFALLVAETAWRSVDPGRGVCAEQLRLVLETSSAWRWTVVVSLFIRVYLFRLFDDVLMMY